MGKTKEQLFKVIEESSGNRATIVLAAKAISSLKEPCEIDLHLQNNVGVKFLSNKKKWVNRDVGDQLSKAISEGGHVVHYIDDSFSSEGKNLQNDLAKRMKEGLKC